MSILFVPPDRKPDGVFSIDGTVAEEEERERGGLKNTSHLKLRLRTALTSALGLSTGSSSSNLALSVFATPAAAGVTPLRLPCTWALARCDPNWPGCSAFRVSRLLSLPKEAVAAFEQYRSIVSFGAALDGGTAVALINF